jgi:hypothetical protein
MGMVKRAFYFMTVRYRGLTKDDNRQFVTDAPANIFMARNEIGRAPTGQTIPAEHSKPHVFPSFVDTLAKILPVSGPTGVTACGQRSRPT